MGPIALFDKSFLEGLNPDEAVWFDHFFLANVCPMFYVETQSDLAKEGSNRGTPEELVRRLANKFPDFSGSPNAHHTTMCTANLLGEEVPLRAQVILPRGCQATVSGQAMAILPESLEAKAFLRWTQGQYAEEERQAAAQWRASSIGCPTAEVLEMLKTMGAYEERACGTLASVRSLTDDVMCRLRTDQQLTLACGLLGVYPAQLESIVERFAAAGQPPLATFAPTWILPCGWNCSFTLRWIDRGCRPLSGWISVTCSICLSAKCSFPTTGFTARRHPFCCDPIRSLSLRRISKGHSGN
jgi:hypothetical protein